MSERIKHEYLRAEEYYESRGVGGRAKSDKTCEHCGKLIPKGMPHDMHHFYPEFYSYPVHKECEKGFMDSLLLEGELGSNDEEEEEEND